MTLSANSLILLSIIPAFSGLVVGRVGQVFEYLWGWVPTPLFYRFLDACIASAAVIQLGGMVWTLI